MANTIPVPYKELEDGLQEGINSRGPWAKKKYLVAWSDRYKFANAMGATSTTTGYGNPWFTIPGYRYPPSPNMYALEVLIEPAGSLVTDPLNPTWVAWTNAVITVTFGIPEFNFSVSDDPQGLQCISQDPADVASLVQAKQKVTFGYESYPIPGSILKFSDGTKFPTPATVKVPVITIAITWMNYPYQPFGNLKDLVGSVNNAKFLSCDAGKLFLDALDTDPHAMSDGTKVQDVLMVFKYRTIDWNKFLRPDGLTWDTLTDSGGNTVYQKQDFTKLLLKPQTS